MSERWFRTYEGIVDDPKLQLLPDRLFKTLINIWALTSANGGKVPPLTDIAFRLRISRDRAKQVLAELVVRRLLEKVGDDLVPHNWSGRQYQSDRNDPTAGERMRRWRERNATVTPTVTEGVTPKRDVTPQRTETDTDPETEVESSSQSTVKTSNVAPSQASGATRSPEHIPEKSTSNGTSHVAKAGKRKANGHDPPDAVSGQTYPDEFEELWREYRPIASPNATKADAYKAWAKLGPRDRRACWTGVVRYAVWFVGEKVRRANDGRSPVEVKHLATFINKRGWEPFMEEEAQRVSR